MFENCFHIIAAGRQDDGRDVYQRPHPSAAGSNADYSATGGNFDVTNKKMARYERHIKILIILIYHENLQLSVTKKKCWHTNF